MPQGGFGNLIALPLQGRPRRDGNSVFLDEDFRPHADPWCFLSQVRRMTPGEVSVLVEKAGLRGRILGVRLPVDEEDEEPWLAPPSRRRPEAPVQGPLPPEIEMVLGDQVYIRIIQVLLGHNNLSTTARYTQVANTTIARTTSPLDRLPLTVVPPG